MPFGKSFREEFRLLKVFYIWQFLWGFSAFTGAYTILYFLGLGFSFSKVGLIVSIWALGRVLFEIPTGAFADLYGRKLSSVLSCFLCAIFLFLTPLATSFWILAILMLFLSASTTLTSGADRAWLVDYLKSKKKPKMVQTAIARQVSFFALGAAISFALSGIVVAFYSMTLLWYIESFLVLLTGFFIMFFGREEFFRPRNIKLSGILSENFRISGKSLKYALRHRVLFYLLAAQIFISLGAASNVIWQPLMLEIGYPISMIGPIFALVTLFGVVAPNLSMKYLSFFRNEKNSLIFGEAFLFLPYLLLAFVSNLSLFFILWVSVFVLASLCMPIEDAYFQKYTPSKIRATTGSLKNMVGSAGSVVAPALAGFLAEAFGLRSVIIFAALMSIPVVLLYSRIKENPR